jgi:hypothetical protein
MEEALTAVRKIRPRRWIVALVLVTFAYVLVVQAGYDCNQAAHYALVRSLADGNPWIDAFHAETCDKSYIDGHYYSNKAPGFPMLLLPLYATLNAAGAMPADSAHAVWLLGLLGNVLPAAVLLALVRTVAERLTPGFGTLTMLTLGLATLVAPFATLMFSHVLSTTLGFAAFFLLWKERAGPQRLRLVAAAGLLAGLAASVEYTLPILGAILGLYALSRPRRLRRALAYAGAFGLGMLPLLLFNVWAFGSPIQLTYSSIVTGSGGGEGAGAAPATTSPPGLWGVGLPHAGSIFELLFAPRGLLTLTPVLALGIAGSVLLYRRGCRAEAFVVIGVCASYLVFQSAFWDEFGGRTPGPRYLMPAVPFLAFPLALAYRALPATTGALAVVSGTAMVSATLTKPNLADADPLQYWLGRAYNRDFTNTVLTLAGLGHALKAMAPAIALITASCVVALLDTARPRWSMPDALLAGAALTALGYGHDWLPLGALVAVLALAAVGVIVDFGRSPGARGLRSPGARLGG